MVSFNEYMKTLYRYLGKTMNVIDFTKEFEENTLTSPNFSEEELGKCKILGIESSSIPKIYNGRMKLSRPMARYIRSYLDESKFLNFIYNSDCSDEKFFEMSSILVEEDTKEWTYDRISQECLDVFIKIIDAGIDKKNKSSKEINSSLMYELNEAIFDHFNQAIHNYQINKFIETIDPSSGFNSNWITENCDDFIIYIKKYDWRPYKSEEIKCTVKIVQHIDDFIQVLDDYTNYLALNMRPTDIFNESDDSVPINTNLEFKDRVKNYRKKLCEIYNKICKIGIASKPETN